MVIAGAGGHALEVLDVLFSLNFLIDEVVFYDDYSKETKFLGRKVLKTEKELKQYFIKDNRFCLGVGNPQLRKKLFDLMKANGGKHYSIISPFAVVSKSCKNNGADIMANCFVSARTSLGLGTLINTASNIHHDVVIGEFDEISPSSVLLGNVIVKSFCSIGANSTILPKLEISDSVIIGAGSVVTNNVTRNQIVKGIPAK